MRWHSARGGAPLRNGIRLADVGVLVALGAALVVIGVAIFDRRDVAV